MSLRRQDDWDDALDEARNNAIARGETKPLEPFVPGPDYDYGVTLTIHLGEPLVAMDFPDGMTVAELKAMIRDWPETDEHGEPCEVWLCNGAALSNQAMMATPLNMRWSEDGSKVWADFMLGHDA